ncbi:MAG: PAS domain S-box protein, partial [Leptolyngbyaceae cyanobacterium bins.59]|nr:PAS domain S-box protein [Leptolyngbyaceae cyanobacterium bins.59]
MLTTFADITGQYQVQNSAIEMSQKCNSPSLKVTLREQAEHLQLATLQRVNQELEQRVAERTVQLEQLNAALRESEERNQLAMEVAQMFTFEWEPTTDIVKRSTHCGSILGLTEEAIEQDTGVNFFQRIHPEDRDRFVAGLQLLSPENNTYKTTYRVVRPDGEIVTLEESGRALFDAEGKLIRLIGMTVDITERERLEAELKANRETLQRQLAEIETIYQSAPIGLNVLDTDLRFIRINQQLADINGLTIEEHLGRTVRELLPSMADTAEALLRPILTTGEPLLNVEIRGETPAQPGVERVWMESFLPLKDGDRVIGINTVCEEITERIKIEEALRQSEAQFRNMADNAPVMIWVTDATGYCTYLSQSWYDFTGQTEATGLGLGWLDAVHPEDFEIAIETFLNANSHSEPFRLEYRLRRQDGEYRWAIDAASPWFAADGQYQGYIGSVIDITDRKQAEQDLRESEEELRLGMQVAGFALARVDYSANRVDLSPEAAALFGLPTDQLAVSRERIHATFHPDDRDELFHIIQQVIDPAGPGWFAQDHRIVLPNGNVKWLTVRKQIFFDRSGEVATPTHAILVALDITERKQIEEALRRSEERYRTLFETMEDGFCILQMLFDENKKPIDYRFLEINPAFENQTGLKDAVGKTARQLLPNLEEHWFEIYGTVALTGKPIRFENGSEVMGRWFEVYAFPIERPRDHKVALLFKDISNRKRTEIDLQEYSDHIRLLYETTRDLLSTTQPLDLVKTVFHKLKDSIGLDLYFNYVSNEQQQTLSLRSYGGVSDIDAQEIACLAMDETISGIVAQQRCQIVYADIQNFPDPKIDRVRKFGVTAYACQPLIAQG